MPPTPPSIHIPKAVERRNQVDSTTITVDLLGEDSKGRPLCGEGKCRRLRCEPDEGLGFRVKGLGFGFWGLASCGKRELASDL
jgi:hypothetical protein